jgi:hypothetical protein
MRWLVVNYLWWKELTARDRMVLSNPALPLRLLRQEQAKEEPKGTVVSEPKVG